jgi:hypothetical protein
MLGQNALSRAQRVAHDGLWILEHFLGRERVDELLGDARGRLHDSMVARLERRGEGRVYPVERREDPVGVDEFRERYAATSSPVVLAGAARSWPAVGKWTPEVFAERFGDDEITLINVAREEMRASTTHETTSETATLREVIEGMRRGSKKYSRFAPLLENHPELMGDIDADWLAARRGSTGVGRFYQMFIGGAGTSTAFHSAAGANLFTQVYGRKRWLIYPTSYNPTYSIVRNRAPFFFTSLDPDDPDEERYPLFRHAHGWEVTLEAGDVLYVPPFFWHQVDNPTDSIGVGFRWYHLPSLLRSSPTQLLLTLAATNPPLWVVRKNRANFNKVYSHVET